MAPVNANKSQSHKTARTLIVSWHWPPTKRASTQVLSNLFCSASPGEFIVLTRGMSESKLDDSTTEPPLTTERVHWPIDTDEDGRIRTWIASVLTGLRFWRRVRRIAKVNSIDRVLAVYPHRYSLLTGWLIARTLGKPLVVYMHDLFAETLIARNRAKRSFWTWLDRRVMHDAALVIVPTREFAEHYQARGVKRTWVLPHCIPNGNAPVPMPALDRELRLAYAGSIYQAHEDSIALFLAGVEGIANLSMTFLSQPNSLLSGQDVQWLDRASAFARLADSHVLVVALGHDTPYPAEIQGCFPSKIADYLALGRPILAIVPPGCFVDRYVNEIGCGLSVTSRDPSEIRAAIETLRDKKRLEQYAKCARAEALRLNSEHWVGELTGKLAGVGVENSIASRADLVAG